MSIKSRDRAGGFITDIKAGVMRARALGATLRKVAFHGIVQLELLNGNGVVGLEQVVFGNALVVDEGAVATVEVFDPPLAMGVGIDFCMLTADSLVR